jgi:CheY-like chemotaxis protein
MRVLIVDDDLPFVEFLMLTLRDIGHEIAGTVTSGGADVMDAYYRYGPDVVLMDFMMPQYNGVTAASQLLSKQPGARVVIMSGIHDTSKLQKVAASAGALGVLKKPFTQIELQDLLAVLPYAVQRPRLSY